MTKANSKSIEVQDIEQSEAFEKFVSALDARIRAVAGSPEDHLSEEDVREITEDFLRDQGYGDGGYGDGGYGGDINESLQEEIQNTLQKMQLASSPNHTGQVAPGTPEGDYHQYGDWGQIITVHEPVQWRSAVVDADQEGVTKLVVYEIDYEEQTTYSLGDVHATRDIHHEDGPQEIYPEITLPAGQYFISRDSETVEPMRRAETNVEWDEFNDEHSVPVTFECSWRAFASYRPGTEAYQKYRDNGWHKRLYYFGSMEFGYQQSADTNSA